MHKERGGGGGVMILTHVPIVQLPSASDTLKTSFPQLLNIFHALKQTILGRITLENLQNVGSEFTAAGIHFQVPGSQPRFRAPYSSLTALWLSEESPSFLAWERVGVERASQQRQEAVTDLAVKSICLDSTSGHAHPTCHLSVPVNYKSTIISEYYSIMVYTNVKSRLTHSEVQTVKRHV